MRRIPNRIKPIPKVRILYYINAFDSKRNYELKTKNPTTLQEVMKAAITIENNRKVVGRVGKRDDARIFNPRAPKKTEEEEKMNKVLSYLKKMNKIGKQQFYHRDRPRLHDMPYNTT